MPVRPLPIPCLPSLWHPNLHKPSSSSSTFSCLTIPLCPSPRWQPQRACIVLKRCWMPRLSGDYPVAICTAPSVNLQAPQFTPPMKLHCNSTLQYTAMQRKVSKCQAVMQCNILKCTNVHCTRLCLDMPCAAAICVRALQFAQLFLFHKQDLLDLRRLCIVVSAFSSAAP